MKSRLGGKKLMHPVLQDQKIKELQYQLQQLDSDGYEILQADESLYSADSYAQLHWSAARQPIMKTARFTNYPKIVVCGVISPVRGNVYYHLGEHSFNAEDMVDVLKSIR